MLRILVAAGLALASAGAPAAERIVTLAPHLAELVCAVGRCDRLVGVVAYTDSPASAASRPQVGDAFNVNLEVVVALQPDLVLAWGGGTPAQTVERLRRVGMTVEGIAVRDLDGIATALESVGRRVGADEEGRAAARAYRERLDALRREYAGRRRLRVFYQIETDPAFSINRRSPIHEALELCGGDNVFADLPTLAGAVSAEAVLAARPEVVVHSTQENPAEIAGYWSRWPGLAPADPQRRVVIDANTLTRQSPRVLDGVAELCAGLERVRALGP